MSDDQTRPIEPEAPVPPPATPSNPGAQDTPGAPGTPGIPTGQGQPAYAMPLPAGYPAYAAAQRPRFADQVMGMRGVVATALAALVIGAFIGFALGWATGDDHHEGFGRGPGFFQQRGAFPNNSN